jgi:DNA repair exonuclease SbcCD ATPase subunit
VRHAEARVLAARQQRAQLIRDRDRLQATLDDINYRISVIDRRRAALERGLAGLNDRAAVQQYVGDLQAALRAYDDAATDVIDFAPPPYLHEEGLRRLQQQRQSLIASRAEARDIAGRLAQIAVEFAAGQVAQEVVVRFLRWALTRLGLAFLNPLVSAAATVADIIGFIQLAIDAYNTVRG